MGGESWHNKVTGANAGGLPQLPIRTRWAARIAQFRRSPAMKKEEWSRRTLRMSLALLSAVEQPCTGRRASSACDSRQHASHPLVAAQYGSNWQLRESARIRSSDLVMPAFSTHSQSKS